MEDKKKIKKLKKSDEKGDAKDKPKPSEEGDQKKVGRGRGFESSSDSGSGSGTTESDKATGSTPSSGTKDSKQQSDVTMKTIESEDRKDGRRLWLQSETYKTRPESYDTSSFKPVENDPNKKFVANYFRLNQMKEFEFVQYRIDIIPETDEKNIRRALIAKCRSHLKGYVFDGGSMIFVTRPLQSDPLEIATRLDNNPTEYKLIFRKTNLLINQADGTALHVFNVILRKAMAGLNLKEIQRHLYDIRAKIQLPEFKLELLPGYITSIRKHEQDILICTEITHKVMRQETLLQILTDFVKRGGDYRSEFQREVVGTVVMTPYNSKTYRIDDVKFDANPRNTFDMRGTQKSFADYYLERYNIKLKDLNQPLLISNPKARDIRGGRTDPVILIPELCVATGLTDAMRTNFHMMRAMGEYTRLNPFNRAKVLKEFSRRINQSEASQDVLESFGLEMERDLVQLGGRVINPEKIIFGNDRTFQNDKNADWTNAIRSNTMWNTQSLSRWGIVYPVRMNSDVIEFMKIFRDVARGQRFEVSEPKEIKLPDDRSGTYAKALEEFCSKDPKFVMIFLPNNKADLYKIIKNITYVKLAIPNQVCCLKTIQPKKGNWAGVKSIATKILLQMNCKLGGIPWMIGIPMKGVMVIGFDVTHDTATKSHSYGAFVASMDLRESVKYYSAVSKHQNGQEIAGNIAIHFQQALITFKREHGTLPDRIIFYRDGVGDGQIEFVHTYEVQKIRDVLKTNYGEIKPKFAFVIVSKRINTRFFEIHQQGQYENPVPGTVIDNTITLPQRYEFFLVSQTVRQGTVSPTNYNIIFDTFGLQPDRLQHFTYKMTHLYYNWTGTVRVPMVVQYAHKLSILIGQFLHALPNNHTNLCERLYFL
ncbi:hypothetical protein PVAND_002289 [Polypedilum vanderplanki]|uniref:Uncharacterized protein n=1 Tax=Polypedilum vanderplanki TaxID=319348 RepID=A0A9J6BQS5_POLVA|nr:hypothetical protein PVAND_002289 [Polypedilum vanderplanki]